MRLVSCSIVCCILMPAHEAGCHACACARNEATSAALMPDVAPRRPRSSVPISAPRPGRFHLCSQQCPRRLPRAGDGAACARQFTPAVCHILLAYVVAHVCRDITLPVKSRVCRFQCNAKMCLMWGGRCGGAAPAVCQTCAANVVHTNAARLAGECTCGAGPHETQPPACAAVLPSARPFTSHCGVGGGRGVWGGRGQGRSAARR